jgi:hypothetical protein
MTTSVQITIIICATLVLISLISTFKKDNKKEDDKK